MTVFYHSVVTGFPEVLWDCSDTGFLFMGINILPLETTNSQEEPSQRTENRPLSHGLNTPLLWCRDLNPQRLGDAQAKCEPTCMQGSSQPPDTETAVPVENCGTSQNKGVGGRQRLRLTRLTYGQASVDRGKLLQLSDQSRELQQWFSIWAVKWSEKKCWSK